MKSKLNFNADTLPANEIAQLRSNPKNLRARISERRKTEIVAHVETDDARDIICTIRDVSQGGAKITMPPHFRLPQVFNLRFAKGQRVFRVNLVWRRHNVAGVSIIQLIK